MSCYYHPNRDSVSMCSACGQPVCAECNYVTGTHPMCRHCWELRISNTEAGASNTPVKTKKFEEKERLPIEKSAPALAATEFIAPEPEIHDREKVEPPAYHVKEMLIAYEPPVQAKPTPPAEPLTNKEPRILFDLQELTPPYAPTIDDVRAVPAEQPTHQSPSETGFQPSQTPHATTEQVIYLGPASAPQTLPPETETPVPWSTSAQEIKHEKPKPKLDIGNRARGLLGSLSKLKPSFGGKGKQQEEPQYTQVAQQTFQCHQCGAENESQPSRVEPPAQATPPAAESIIYLGPPAQVPQPLYVEPEPQSTQGIDEQLANYKEPKPKLDLGKKARGLLGSLSKLKLNFGGKGKQQVGPHYIQVAHQTFQCHQCGAENYIGELFCQGCGSWFQYTCPSCGAVVDPGFDSCPGCLTELGWGHMAEEEYHGYP